MASKLKLALMLMSKPIKLISLSVLILAMSTAQSLAHKKILSSSDLLSNNIETFFDDGLENEKLHTVVNLSFHKTKASDILSILSKTADFNLVFPKELDRELSINLRNKEVKDAIDDIMDILSLNYILKDNSLIISKFDISEADFSSIEVLYNKAGEISDALNHRLFRQLIVNQPADAFKPYAFKHPAKNLVVIAGNKEQLKMAREFTKELDQKPFVKIYTPSYLSLENAYEFIALRPDMPEDVQVSKLQDKSLIVKGLEHNVLKAIEELELHDLPYEALDFYIEIFSIQPSHREDVAFENIFGLDKAQKINASYAVTAEFNNLMNFLNKKHFEEISINKDETKEIKELTLKAQRSFLNSNQYSIELLGTKIENVNKSDVIALRTKASQFNKLRKELGLKKDDLVLTLIKQK